MNDPKSDCQSLMSSLFPFAKEMLNNHRQFYPFGGTMSANGEMGYSGGWTGEEQPPSSEIIELLKNAFSAGAKRGDYRATAIFYDVRTIPPGKSEKQDAIVALLDHQDDYSIVVVYPYTFTPEGQLEIEHPHAFEGEYEIF